MPNPFDMDNNGHVNMGEAFYARDVYEGGQGGPSSARRRMSSSRTSRRPLGCYARVVLAFIVFMVLGLIVALTS